MTAGLPREWEHRRRLGIVLVFASFALSISPGLVFTLTNYIAGVLLGIGIALQVLAELAERAR